MSRPLSAWEEAEKLEADETVARWDQAVPQRAPVWPEAPGTRRALFEREDALPGAAPRARRRVRVGRLALVVLGGYLAVMAVSGEMTLMHVRAQADALSREAQTLSAQNRALAQRVRLLHTVSYTDELARTEMGYVSPGEVPLVPVSREGTNPN